MYSSESGKDAFSRQGNSYWSGLCRCYTCIGCKKMYFDIIFMDPPYQLNAEKEVLTAIADSKIADEDTQIIIEATLDREFSEDELAGFDVVRVKEYKTNKHIFLQKSSREA